MIKFTTKNKNKEEESKKGEGKRINNKEDMNNKTKEVTKNLTIHLTMTNKSGSKFSQNINHNQDLLLRRQLLVIPFLRSHKIQVK